MPGPYDDIYTNQSLRGDGLAVLDVVGGYAKTNRVTPRNTTQYLDAEENNKIRQALSDIVARDRGNWCDVRDFGVTFGSVAQQVRITNMTRLRLAAAQASSAAVPLYGPPGRLEFEVQAADTYATLGEGTLAAGVYTTTALHIIGGGRFVTTWAWYPASVTFAYNAFYADAYSGPVDFSMSGLTMTGPATGSATYASRGIRYNGRQLSSAARDYFFLQDVKFSGAWREDVRSSNGNQWMDVRRSEFTGATWSGIATTNLATGGNDRHCRVYNSHFHDSCTEHTLSPAVYENGQLYIEPTTALLLEGCRFSNTTSNTGFALNIEQFGPTTPKRAYSQVSNCSFYGAYNGYEGDIAVSGDAIYGTTMIGNEYESSSAANAMRVQHIYGKQIGAQLNDVALEMGGLGGASHNLVSGCNVNVSASYQLTYCILVSDGVTAIEGGEINCAANGARMVSFQDGGRLSMKNVMFVSTAAAPTEPFFLSDEPTAQYIDNCKFLGDRTGLVVRQETHLNDCVFSSTTKPNIDNQSTAADSIVGHDNAFSNVAFTSSAAPLNPQNIRISSRMRHSTVASGSTLALHPGYGTYHVTGTDTISTIHIKDATTSQFFSGTITLIADGAWTLSNGGNIRLRSAASSRTVAVNEVVHLLLDPVNALLFEQ